MFLASPVNGRQDYRLDFTEVEGTLEAVPEEAAVTKSKVEDQVAPPTPKANDDVLESNASDVAFSECSYQTDSIPPNVMSSQFRPSYMSSSFIRSSEPLTAKQQVALWLTRTSTSDLSSMPSLRSLIFPNSKSK